MIDHPDVDLPTYIPAVLEEDPTEATSEVASTSDSRIVTSHHGSSSNDPMEISLVVPDSLGQYSLFHAWQDLQSSQKSFDADFISEAAKKVIEETHGVKIVPDHGQKVIFIGSSSDETANLVKTLLSTLLQDHLVCACKQHFATASTDRLQTRQQEPPPHLRHVFFVSQTTYGNWAVDVRNIMDINPNIRSSTILDPWHFDLPEKYNLLTRACCLRVCLEDPFRKGDRNTKWSLFGPRAKSVFENQKPYRIAEMFKNLKVAKRSRTTIQTDDSNTDIFKWINDTSAVVPELTTKLEDLKIPTALTSVIGEDDPVPLDWENNLEGNNLGEDDPIPLDGGDDLEEPFGEDDPIPLGVGRFIRNKLDNHVEPPNLLDQADPILLNPSSTLQRPMLPPKHIIRVPNPDYLPDCTRQPPVLRQSPKHLDELGKFIISMKNIMTPMCIRYGTIGLHAEIGRYYAHKVPSSGCAYNRSDVPAHGWEAEDLRLKLNKQESFFTKALTCFGNDVNFLTSMKIKDSSQSMWKHHSSNVFIDFHFRAPKDDGFSNLILQVNTQDYSWTIRDRNNTSGYTYVHCLGQHWDFRMRLSYDHTLEYKEHWGKFAQALVDSLEVNPPRLEFQYIFDFSPIVVCSARIRQVCRFQHHDKTTFLDMSRILPTKTVLQKPQYLEVTTIPQDIVDTGEFSQWYEATISSVRLEELLRQNAELIPGEQAGWDAEQMAQEGLFKDLYEHAASVIQQMDGVGLVCNNGYDMRCKPDASRVDGSYQF